MNNLLNTYLGQYYLAEVIGRGSTSVVYKAYQSALDRFVAVKVLAADIDPQFETRFKREAHAVAQLQHPNILPIYDYGEQDGVPYFAMQYVEGSRTLHDTLAGEPIEPLAALRLALPLLSALRYAHERGVIHRDIKPANIMLPRPDWPLLADFGIAKLIDDSQQLTPPGQSVGTAIYMAPERARSTAADARGDLYSVGVVLYEMLTGEVPFDGVSPVEVLRKHVREPVPPPRAVNPALPEAVEPVLLRALAKEPGKRYQSAGEMAVAIERLIGQLQRLEAQRDLQRMLGQPADGGADANPYETRELTSTGLGRVRQRNNRLAAALLALTLLLVLGGIVLARTPADLAGAAATPAAPTLAPAASAPTGAAATAPPATAAPDTPAPATATAPPAPTQPPAPTTAPPTAAPAPTAAPQAGPSGQATSVRLDDASWQGGYRFADGRTYGGRSATWIYGTSTSYSTMRAAFRVSGRASGTAALTIEGMDSEDRRRTPISIAVNGVEIFNGANPLPDDDHPLESGTWASYTWQFDAALLRQGQNEISIANLAEGAFSLPPFFMLDYADVSFSLQK